MPKTKLGRWSVGLHCLFLTAIIVSVILVKVLGLLNFDDHWWDVSAAILFPASIVASILGIVARLRYQDSSVSVFLSILFGSSVILFILFHSLFISD